jgi:trehalose 2-sulfotransferase
VLAEGTTSNGVFGAKVMWGYFDDFINNLRTIPSFKELPTPTLLSTAFPHLRYIWVTRNDKLRQAISLWKAIQTWTWREDESSTPRDQSVHPKKELCFHFQAIDHLRQQIVENERAWQSYFDASAIEPLQVTYEDLSENYEATTVQILRYLHIPISECTVFAERRMKRQADALSEEWVARYHHLKQ